MKNNNIDKLELKVEFTGNGKDARLRAQGELFQDLSKLVDAYKDKYDNVDVVRMSYSLTNCPDK